MRKLKCDVAFQIQALITQGNKALDKVRALT